jgi:hypothetical protein
LRYSYDPLNFVPSTPIVLNGESGVLSWTPGERDGPGIYTISVRVIDNGSPALSASRMIRVNVIESNSPPVLSGIPGVRMPAGALLSFTAQASDNDAPANHLRFTLSPNSPAGASIDPVTGQFQWIPLVATSDSSNRITLIVTDDGPNPLSAAQSFDVFVEANSIVVNAAPLSRSQQGAVTLTFNTRLGGRYQIQFKQSLHESWSNLGTPFVSQQSVVQIIDDDTANSDQRFYRLVVLE